jgi:hypothetical protein
MESPDDPDGEVKVGWRLREFFGTAHVVWRRIPPPDAIEVAPFW